MAYSAVGLELKIACFIFTVMGKIFYLLFIKLYPLAAKIISPFNEKAKLWVAGRKDIFEKIKASAGNDSGKKIWVHCASLGEFEQGLPVIEALKKNYPAYKLVISFFSPSGYEVLKNFSGADYIFYLPTDSPNNASAFFDLINPSLVIFIKYEFWYYYLAEAYKRKIPALLVSGIFRKSQPFFKWYGAFHKEMLAFFSHLFVQNQASVALLNAAGFTNVTLSGDTRFDRVLEIAEHHKGFLLVKDFCADKITIVAGSTWSLDDEELDHYANTHPDYRFIIAPHDIQEDRLKECEKLYQHCIRYSKCTEAKKVPNPQYPTPNVLLIDNIGMLKYLYKYATICFVGGGFGGDGVHNVAEAAVYGKPVLFGPVYEKFAEAIELVEVGAGFPVMDALELEDEFNDLLGDKKYYDDVCASAKNYIKNKAGATTAIILFIHEKRLLTN